MICPLKSVMSIAHVITWVQTHGYATGSSAFFHGAMGNDRDYVVRVNDFDMMIASIGEEYSAASYLLQDDTDSDNVARQFVDLKLRRDGDDCYTDIIIVSDDEFAVWVRATDAFRALIYADAAMYETCRHNKDVRVHIFETIKKAIRAYLCKKPLCRRKRGGIDEHCERKLSK